MFCEILRKGSSTPIVFLHGYLGSGQDWRLVASHLTNRTCLAYDLPGHGKTPWIGTRIEDLLSNTFPSESIDLIGYSLGGRLALRFAACHPSRIHSLTLLSTNYGLCRDEEKLARLQTDQIWAQKILTLSWDEFLHHWYDQPIFSSIRQNPQAMDAMMAMRKTQRPKELALALLNYSLGSQECFRDQLLAFSRPLQILYGEKDEKLAKLYAGWPKSHAIAGAGHVLHFERPQEVAALQMAFNH